MVKIKKPIGEDTRYMKYFTAIINGITTTKEYTQKLNKEIDERNKNLKPYDKLSKPSRAYHVRFFTHLKEKQILNVSKEFSKAEYSINLKGIINNLISLMYNDTEPYKKWAMTQIFQNQVKEIDNKKELQEFIKSILELYLIRDKNGLNLSDDSTTINKVFRDIINFIGYQGLSGKTHKIKEINKFIKLCIDYNYILSQNPLIHNLKIR